MIKYTTTALVLKMFSSTVVTRRLYRMLGNAYGAKKRVSRDIPPNYIERIRRFLALNAAHEIVKNGDRVIEIGTGWLHWEALTLSLFFDLDCVLFDVWDNRQLRALQHYFCRLDLLLDSELELTDVQRKRAHHIIGKILSADSFERLYRRLNLRYIVEPSGRLSQFPDETFDLVVSAGVLEHIDRKIAQPTIREFYRVLKPGGSSAHSINMADHLYAYDRRVSQKQYLHYSEHVWKFFFENQVQYFNRIQRSEWLALFADSGFRLVHENPDYIPIDNLKVHSQFTHIDSKDIECTWLKLLHRRPHLDLQEHPVSAHA